MSTYYYLTSSFPMLVLGDPPPFSIDELRTSAATVLTDEDLTEFNAVVSGELEQGQSGFSMAWRNAETQLRNAVVKQRANQRSADARSYLREHDGFSVQIEKGVTDAYAKPNPLEREMSLDRLRWGLLDDIAARDPFGLPAVLAFVVKLQLCERWTALDEEKGQEVLEEVLAANLKTDQETAETVENEDTPQRGEEEHE